MKRFLPLFLGLFALASGLRAQSPVVEITDDITTFASWTNDNVYLLKGTIYVKGVLLIAPGTIIKGDKATKGTLVVTKTGVINANSVLDDDPPIVFTSSEPAGSRAPGDWGGIVLLGEAPVNATGGTATFSPINGSGGEGSYGGAVAADGSGSMQKIRIEYAGATVGGQVLPGMTLCGVGSGTFLTDIMVSNCAGDGFRFLGGTANLRYLVSHRNQDDDFDISQGYTGQVQRAVASRDNDFVNGDASGANGLEIRNDATGSANTPLTNPLFSNFTVIGPRATPASPVDGDFANGVWVGGNGRVRLFNSAVLAWPTGVNINGAGAQAGADADETVVRTTYVAGCADSVAADGGWNVGGFFGAPAKMNRVFTRNDSLYLDDPFDLDFPDFRPTAPSPLRGTADFSAPDLSASAFMETVGFIGAFGRDADWTLCWTNFDPAGEPYLEGSDELAAPIRADYTYTVGVAADSLTVNFVNLSSGEVAWFWQFGDGSTMDDTSSVENPVWVYPSYGTFETRLKVFGPCDNIDSISNTVSISGLGAFLPGALLTLYPNPATTRAVLELDLPAGETLRAGIVDLAGRRLRDLGRHELTAGTHRIELPVDGLQPGLYLVTLEGRRGARMLKLLVR